MGCLIFLKVSLIVNESTIVQAEVLYKLIEDCACIKGDGSEIVLDLFCGTGTIGLTLARRSFCFSQFISLHLGVQISKI